MTDPDKIDMLELMLVGGRVNPERSNAKPRDAYDDPALHVEFESEKRRQQKRQKQKPKFRIKWK